MKAGHELDFGALKGHPGKHSIGLIRCAMQKNEAPLLCDIVNATVCPFNEQYRCDNSEHGEAAHSPVLPTLALSRYIWPPFLWGTGGPEVVIRESG